MALSNATDPTAELLEIWENPLAPACLSSFHERAMYPVDLERWINRGGIKREIPPEALNTLCQDTVSMLAGWV
jgi:hypothetical protein